MNEKSLWDILENLVNRISIETNRKDIELTLTLPEDAMRAFTRPFIPKPGSVLSPLLDGLESVTLKKFHFDNGIVNLEKTE